MTGIPIRERLAALWSRFSQAPNSVRYGIGVAAAVWVVLIRVALNPIWGNGFPYVMVFPATVFVALLVGFGPGLVSVAVSFLLTGVFVLASDHPEVLSGEVLYIVFDTAVVYIASIHRTLWLTIESQASELRRQMADILDREKSEAALRQLNDLLEERVAERTQALTEEAKQRRKAEAALSQAQKLEAVGRLTGGIAHDFNNIMTVVSGALELIARSPDDTGRVQRWAAMAQHAVERATKLTTQLLVFSRRKALHPEDVEPAALIREFEDLIRRAVGESVVLEITAEEGLWLCRVDPGQFESALVNLLLNARDAMPEGGRIGIELRNAVIEAEAAARFGDMRPGDYVSIGVRDTGHGIPPEVLEHVFEPFFTTKAVGKGTGLGLSTVWGFAKQSQGHVEIATAVGTGTVVTLYLPRVAASASAAAPVRSPGPAPGSGTILVAEDDEDVRAVTSAALTALGYTVLEVGDAEAALGILREGRQVDLLLSDVVMPPGMSGVELANAARLLRPGLRIMLVSGYAAEVLERHGARPDAFPLLSKPYRQAELGEAVASVLAG